MKNTHKKLIYIYLKLCHVTATITMQIIMFVVIFPIYLSFTHITILYTVIDLVIVVNNIN